MEPNVPAIVALCLTGAAGLVFVFWLNHKWVTRHQPKREAAPKKARAGALKIALSYIMGRAEPVNDYEDSAPVVMSRVQNATVENSPSSLQTRPQTVPDQTEDPKVRRAKLLDTYKVLRELGMSRDDARALLKPWGIPLDNNLWADAAPQEPPTITPIAGRPTSAKFHEGEPDLEYKPLS